MKLLIDGDMLIHRFCAACQEMSPFDKTVLVKACPEETWRTIVMRLEQCLDIAHEYTEEPIVPVLCFSSPRNYRKELNENYKANRKGKAKPVLYSDMVEKAKRHYMWEEWDGIEADDVMGILQNSDTIICTGDKDLKQVAGLHLNLIDPEGGVFEVTEEEGLFLFYSQCLSGDTVDGFYGCPRIGKKKAEKILKAEEGGHPWNRVVNTYKEAMSAKSMTITLPSGEKKVEKLEPVNLGLGYRDALMTARMAYILQKETDYNKETGEVNLWLPED